MQDHEDGGAKAGAEPVLTRRQLGGLVVTLGAASLLSVSSAARRLGRLRRDRFRAREGARTAVRVQLVSRRSRGVGPGEGSRLARSCGVRHHSRERVVDRLHEGQPEGPRPARAGLLGVRPHRREPGAGLARLRLLHVGVLDVHRHLDLLGRLGERGADPRARTRRSSTRRTATGSRSTARSTSRRSSTAASSSGSRTCCRRTLTASRSLGRWRPSPRTTASRAGSSTRRPPAPTPPWPSGWWPSSPTCTGTASRVLWYDAMTESGSVGWQGALNANNDAFFARVRPDVRRLPVVHGESRLVGDVREGHGPRAGRALRGHRHRRAAVRHPVGHGCDLPGQGGVGSVGGAVPAGLHADGYGGPEPVPRAGEPLLGRRGRRPVQLHAGRRRAGAACRPRSPSTRR